MFHHAELFWVVVEAYPANKLSSPSLLSLIVLSVLSVLLLAEIRTLPRRDREPNRWRLSLVVTDQIENLKFGKICYDLKAAKGGRHYFIYKSNHARRLRNVCHNISTRLEPDLIQKAASLPKLPLDKLQPFGHAFLCCYLIESLH